MANTSVIVIPEGKFVTMSTGSFAMILQRSMYVRLLKNDLLMSISICPSKSELNTLYNWVQENPVRILSFLIKIAASRLRRTLKSSSSVKKRLLKHVMLKTVLSN